MSTMRKEPPIEVPTLPRPSTRDDFARDLETFEQRLAESREAILSTGSSIDAQRAARRKDDLARDLELLVQRLAQSREAIVRLLATEAGGEPAGDEPAVAPELEPPPIPGTPLRALRSPAATPGVVTPGSSERPTSRLVPETGPTPVRVAPSLTALQAGPRVSGRGTAEPEQVSDPLVPVDEPDIPLAGVPGPVGGVRPVGGARSARRRVLASVLMAVGIVVLLTTVVSLL
jgi:hypothetical protein